MELNAENVTKVFKALGIEISDEENALEALELDTVVEKATELAARPEKAEPEAEDKRTLDERAAEEGKVVLSASDVQELRENAKRGKQAAEELHQSKFDSAFEKALDEARVDAKEETRELWQKLYDADDEATLSALEKLPKLASTSAKGSGKGAGEETPEGVDADRAELDRRVRAHMKEHNETDYLKALDAVQNLDAEGATA